MTSKSVSQAAKIEKINNLILSYAEGDFHKKGKVSADLDELDTILSGVNMLGEELLTTTISRDYFSSIYNAVKDMMLVVSPEGLINNINNSGSAALQYEPGALIGLPINTIVHKDYYDFLNNLKKKLRGNIQSMTVELNFLTAKKETLNVSCSCSRIMDRNEKFKGFLIIANDITERLETEKVILRTIVETQEKERKRVSEDLHDSLGQELSAVKLFLNSLNKHFSQLDSNYQEVFTTANKILDNTIENLRAICFDLMPVSLEAFGINEALSQLISRLSRQTLIRFDFQCTHDFPVLPKSIEIVIYRIVQEFINNTIKHAKASEIQISLAHDSKKVEITIKDNGVGFNLNEKKISAGKGLNNIKSRVLAFNGKSKFVSKLNSGTKLVVTFPIIK